MKHISLRILVTSMATIFLWSCGEETIEWELQDGVPDLLVVEGVITNERKAHEVRITRPVADPSDTPEPVSRAVVAIFDGRNARLLTETSPGVYHTAPYIRAVINRLYTLYILHEGIEYTADSYLVPVQRMDPLRYHRIQGQQNLYELDLRESNDPSMLEITLDWSHLPAYSIFPEEETKARIVYYTVKSIDVNKMFSPDKERVFFPAGTRVIRRKYSMSPPQEDFVRTLMAETEWRGGIFDVQPGNVRTNLSDGAVGYFSASTVVSDTTVILPLN